MRRAPSSRGKDDALRYSVFDAAHQIGLSDPNALRWLEQNSNISEEDEEEELQREARPPSDAHPPSLVFSASSHDSSIASPSNDHSTSYRAPYRPATKATYQANGHSQFQPNQPPSGPLIFTQTQPEIRSPLGSNASSPRISPAQPPLPAGIKQFEQWPPTQLAIASLSPPSQPNSRAPSPGDKGNSKQAPEPKKSRKLTKAQRAEHEPEIITTSRKTSASGESGIGGAPPTLPFLPFPAPTAGETLSSDASVSGLSAISGLSGSSSGTVTQSQFGNGNGSTLFPPSRASNEPRSFFEDDTDDIPASSSGHGHTQNSPSTSTANSAEAPHGKEKEGKLLRTMRSFKLSLKGQKAPKLPAPPVPSLPSQPPILTLKLDKDAMLKQELAQNPPKDAASQAKDREERVLKIAEMFTSELTRTTRSASETGTTLSQPLSELEHKGQSDLGHSKADSELGHAVESDLGHAPIRIAGASRGANNKPAVARRRSVDELDAGVVEPTKVVERTRAGTVGTRSGHARTRSKSGDFTGIGWEKGNRPPVPDVRPAEVMKPEDMVKPTSVADAIPAAAAEVTSATKVVASKPTTRFFVTNPTRPARPANKPPAKPVQPNQPVQPVQLTQPAQPTQPVRPNPLSPVLSFDSEARHSLEREGFGARGERDESRALEVQHQLQSFVASMRGKEEEDDGADSINDGFGRASGEGIGLGRTSEDAYGRGSEDSRRGVARVRAQGDESDTLRSSGEYDPDPFRVRAPKSRLGVATNLPRPESEAIPHQIVIPANQLPKEVAPIRIAIPTKRTVPPVAYRSPEDELPKGLVRNSSISARPSVIINDGIGKSMAAEVAEIQSVASATTERASVASQESEFGLGYSGFDYAREEPVEPSASEEWVVPSPSWAPLELKQAQSPSVGNAGPDPDAIPDSPLEPPIRPGQYLDVRPDRQRASGLSIPRSVTPDSPRPLLIPPRPAMSPFPNAPSPISRSATPLAPSRSTTPLAPARSSTASVLARSTTPQPPPSGPPPSVPPPQARPTSPPQAWRPQLVQRNTPSPPIPRNTLPTRSSSISSMSSVEHGTRSPIARAVPARSVATPSSRPSTASSVQSTASRTTPLRSMSITPTPRERERDELPRHEQSSRFLDPEAVPIAQKRGRVSPFPVKPLRERSASRDRLKEATEQLSQNQREKYPGGVDRLNGTDGFMQVPRVRFIGVRSSNGSSQAGWQGRMEDMNKAESPVQSDAGAWYEEEARPVSWQEYEEPTYLSYDDPEEYGQDSRYSAYEDAAREDDLPAPEAGPDVVAALSALRPSGHEQPAWAVDDTTPASRASTFTLASVYDDDDDIPPVPKTERLAAAVRGMGQNNWAAGRI